MYLYLVENIDSLFFRKCNLTLLSERERRNNIIY